MPSWLTCTQTPLTLLFICLLISQLSACDSGASSSSKVTTAIPPSAPTGTTAAATPASPQTTAQLWARSCALCHVDGNASAPRMGNIEEWRPRLAKGKEVLLTHTLEGFGDMPPLGYCMACERDDFIALIDFMTTGIALESALPEPSASQEPQL